MKIISKKTTKKIKTTKNKTNSKITKNQLKELISKAISVQKNAFTPITNIKVGACLLTEKNNFYEGCNVQSVISGLGNCAERSAVDHAVIHGEYKFKAICVASKSAFFLCGACLQYLNEFSQIANKDINIYITDLKGNIKTKTTLWKTIKLYGPRDGKKNIKEYTK